MSDAKPLPALPPALPGTLSTTAQEHRARFIRYTLNESTASIPESSIEAWADALETALDDMLVHAEQHDWLAGIKKRKVAQHAPVTRQSEARASESSDSTRESSVSSIVDPRESALSQIRARVEQTAQQTPSFTMKHLLLCLSPMEGQTSFVGEGRGFDVLSSNVSCAFKPGLYTIHDAEEGVLTNSILYGLDNWEDSDDIRLVGGTFTFHGITSPVQHHALAKLLRICIFMSLSMLLEQHFLVDSGIILHFPRPKADKPTLAPSVANPIPVRPSKPRSPFSAAGLFSFFSKKAVPQLPPNYTRGSSFDLGMRPLPSEEATPTQRTSLESNAPSRLRRFSFLSSEPRPSNLSTPTAGPTFSTALARVEGSQDFFSTSPGVRFAPPSLLTSLAAKEKDLAKPGQEVKLKAIEKLGMSTILGWDSRTRGAGMSGVPGFVLQQEISVLACSHVSSQAQSSSTEKVRGQDKDKEKEKENNEEEAAPAKLISCGSPGWKTYRYFSDDCLGGFVRRWADEANVTCQQKGCTTKNGDHIRTLVHGRTSITLSLTVPEQESEGDDMMLWTSCSECGYSSDKHRISDGTYMLSFGKFLELLIYSDRLNDTSHCPHSVDRFVIHRHIRFKGYTFNLNMKHIQDEVFEIKAPRLQIIAGGLDRLRREANGDGVALEERRCLRKQIRLWWEGIAEFVDKLEGTLTTSEGLAAPKHLPRLPSADDAYADLEDTPIMGASVTPSEYEVPYNTPGVPKNDYFGISGTNEAPGSATSPPIVVSSDGPSIDDDKTATPTQSRLPSPSDKDTLKPLSTQKTSQSATKLSISPLERLSSLRQTFHKTEQSLYALLSRTPVSSINDVRRAFLSSARGAEKRLYAWQKKHLPSLKDKITAQEPGWFQKECHVVPYGNIIVREDDWGSIIAFTMSTPDYTQEMVNMTVNRSASSSTATSPPASVSPGSTNSTFFPNGSSDSQPAGYGTANSNASSASTSTGGYKLFRSSKASQPDPDQDDVVWHEPEAYSAVISRKEHPRDPTGLLSIRDVLRSKSPISESGSGILNSRFAPSTASGNTIGRTMTPPSAWAKPDVQLSDVQVSNAGVDGKMTSMSDLSDSDSIRMLHELDNASLPSRPGSSRSNHSNAFGEGHIRRGKAASLASISSDASDTTAGPWANETLKSRPHPKPSAQEKRQLAEKKDEGDASTQTAPSSFATFASGVTQAMRLMLNHADSNGQTSSPMSATGKHGLLSTETPIDDRPHIKYDWTIGKRLKFSCTVYYAKQFDNLRRRCGIDEVFLQSLSRSTNWAAEGGKSKSNFWMTADNRFIIKTLLNGWNVADLQVLIEIAPSYFKYMESTASRATVLAKLLGFYTVEIRNLESGNVQSKADLLVMENLFYERNIVKRFDLKGIQGRKVKASSSDVTRRTFFDGDWIEGQQQALTLVQPHSKAMLRAAIQSDADFLAKSNIMDYSLLVGLDEEHKHIACGLVDTIGSYTFAKTLEYKAKQGLNAGKEGTVIPPIEYQERFVNALDQYFVACPDKWSRNPDDRRTTGDPNDLPSVL